ncbi:hypothetical protein O3G_MSEX010879 [Manduca sexta]|uniref:Uncharacterized protein n=1 Tax=Manduca sexta TaxID=7130 RepID=A0A921ZK09_MANSE|nr:hypothetical protein O3G_MSEX010879 [Manduca sexta]
MVIKSNLLCFYGVEGRCLSILLRDKTVDCCRCVETAGAHGGEWVYWRGVSSRRPLGRARVERAGAPRPARMPPHRPQTNFKQRPNYTCFSSMPIIQIFISLSFSINTLGRLVIGWMCSLKLYDRPLPLHSTLMANVISRSCFLSRKTKQRASCT